MEPVDSSWKNVGQLENEDDHVTNVYCKEFDDGLHYAIVCWRYHAPTTLMRFVNGKVVEGGVD